MFRIKYDIQSTSYILTNNIAVNIQDKVWGPVHVLYHNQ
jgi:hypothetical protein